MKLKEILQKEDGKHIYCYKQGVFWVCYEQSAYAIHQEKGYKPTKKQIKNVGQEVVSVGFPQSVMEQWLQENRYTPITQEETKCVFALEPFISLQEYEHWKQELTVKTIEKNETNHQREDIISIIKEFPLAHKTPVQAFFFVKELQEKYSTI